MDTNTSKNLFGFFGAALVALMCSHLLSHWDWSHAKYFAAYFIVAALAFYGLLSLWLQQSLQQSIELGQIRHHLDKLPGNLAKALPEPVVPEPVLSNELALALERAANVQAGIAAKSGQREAAQTLRDRLAAYAGWQWKAVASAAADHIEEIDLILTTFAHPKGASNVITAANDFLIKLDELMSDRDGKIRAKREAAAAAEAANQAVSDAEAGIQAFLAQAAKD